MSPSSISGEDELKVIREAHKAIYNFKKGKIGEMWISIKKFLKKEEGTETVEWAILAALLLAVVAAGWTSLGNIIVGKITDVVAAIG